MNGADADGIEFCFFWGRLLLMLLLLFLFGLSVVVFLLYGHT